MDKVKSQISDKVYEATLDDLYEEDQNLEVDLYKLNVFNKDIMIAPGKVISDAKKDVHYCYVYVIKDGRVAAKLGIYETHAKKGEVYDLTDFEGREFLLFDHYYNEPGSLIQYEMKEEQDTDNIFDYLKRFLKPVTNATAAIKEQRDMIRKITKRLEGTPEGTTLKLFKKQKPYDEEWLDSFKEERENWMFILIVLEIVFNVKFIFEDSDGSEDKLREMVRAPANAKEPTTVIRVSLEDTPRHIVDAPKTKSKAKTALVVESESEEESEEESAPKVEYKKAETKKDESEPKEEEFIPKDEFPSPEVEKETKTKTISSKSESKPTKTFSSKLDSKSASTKPESETKPTKSFTSKLDSKSASTKPETKPSIESEAKPTKSFSSKSDKPVRTFSSKKTSVVEELPLPPEESQPKPRAVSPSVRKSSAEASAKPSDKLSEEPRSVSPSVRKPSVKPSVKLSAEASDKPSDKSTSEKPRSRIIRSAPPPKLKTLGENNA
jgi:hypothetical protein